MTHDELERKVRAWGTLAERLDECQRRIGNMCSELRIPKMTVPPSYKDDDIFICVTLRDAIDDVKRIDSGINDIDATFIGLGKAFKNTAKEINQLIIHLQNIKLKDTVEFSLMLKTNKPWLMAKPAMVNQINIVYSVDGLSTNLYCVPLNSTHKFGV